MSNGKKARGVPSSSEGDSDGESVGSACSVSSIEVCFELFNMDENDYHSVKQYLGNFFGVGDHGVELSALAAFITEELAEDVGTCIKTDGEASDPFGFVTGIPVGLARERRPHMLEGLRRFFGGKLGGLAGAEDFFAGPENVLVFSERLMNVPGAVAGPLYRQFRDDWEAACAEDGAHYGTGGRVLLVTPCFREVPSRLDRERGGKRAKRGEFGVTSRQVEYYYEEFGALDGSTACDFAVNTGHDTGDSRRAFGDVGIEPCRRAFLLTWEALARFIEDCGDAQA